MKNKIPSFLRNVFAGVLLLGAAVCGAFADAVTEWNQAFENSLHTPAERGPSVPFRALAIMHAAMFDAVNGIERKYEPLHVTDAAPPGARTEAAAIQAAYTVLSALRPGSQTAWDDQLAASLATLPGENGAAESIVRGRAWGATVATAILAWRAGDGTSTVLPPFVGSTAAGWWRHAPLGAAPNAGYVYSVAVPFLLEEPSAFDPGPPYGFANRADALASTAYAADVNESKARGGLTSSVRTAAELDEALFLDACDLVSLNALLRAKLSSGSPLVDNVRAFALFNMAWFDAVTVGFGCKYHYAFWRPFQAIRYAGEDNNPATDANPAWGSYIPTPPHPEYPSAHVTFFTAVLRVAERLEGDSGPVELTVPPTSAYPGGTKTYESMSAISDACIEARVNIGYHFRGTAETSKVLGRAIGDAIVNNHLLPRGQRGRGHY